MTTRDPKIIRIVQWCAAALAGVLVGLVPLADSNPPARVLAVLLVVAGLPFGLMRQRPPWLWALVVAWPTVTLRFSDAGWHAIFLLIYSSVGVYAGDWVAQWWGEAHPPARYASGAPDRRDGAAVAADGSRVASDGLPPEMPGRF
jgi:hypothetical protein